MYSKDFLEDAYTRILKIRKFDMRMHEMNKDPEARKALMGIVHSHVGAEAYSVAVSMNLSQEDYMATTYRNHAHSIAWGMPLKGLAAEFYGKIDGVCKGNAGNMHAVDQDMNIVAGFGIIGAGLPCMLGTAFASKYNKAEKVSVVYFGDGAIAQGAFHESMNLASKMELPVLFANDNNVYAMATHCSNNLCHESTTEYAKAYNMKSYSVDGMNFFESYEATKEAVEYIKMENKPVFIEYKNYRFHGQWEGDPQLYQPKAEWEEYWKKEPVTQFETKVLKEKWMSQEELEVIQAEVEKEVDEAYAFAASSTFAKPEHIYKYVYADKY